LNSRIIKSKDKAAGSRLLDWALEPYSKELPQRLKEAFHDFYHSKGYLPLSKNSMATSEDIRYATLGGNQKINRILLTVTGC
jgi:hypothetical protein